jgi:hypothetical protein
MGLTRRCAVLLSAAVAAGLLGCDDRPQPPPDGGPPPDVFGRCAEHDPLRRAFFGDTHVHTTLSLDANIQGTRLDPVDAYRFARGEQVGIQPYDDEGGAGRRLRLSRPLDFVVVSDHAEFLGALSVCNDPSREGYGHDDCNDYRDNPQSAFVSLNFLLSSQPDAAGYPDLCGEGGAGCVEEQRAVWLEVIDAAEDAYDRTEACSLTTFVGYEWSANPSTRNIHRNVVFRNSVVPDLPTGYFDEPTVEGLWAALRRGCLDAGTGCDALTIPHNSNLGNGLMFEESDDDGRPFTAAYAAERAFMEPLIEVFQHKGDSECEPDSSVGDDHCRFEYLPYVNLASPTLGLRSFPDAPNFVRNALGRGLHYRQALGVNPFQWGIVASTDTHLGTPGAVGEATFPGHGGAGVDNSRELHPGLPDIVEFNPGGLAVLWAEENSREALWAAMRRREAYGTSGPRITLRFFGGWGYPAALCDDHDFAQVGYDAGVPMGAELPGRPVGAGAPVFAIRALRDPGVSGDVDSPGTPLQRVQVIKGWIDGGDGGDFMVEVHEVAGSPDNGATVDLASCEPVGAGHDELCAVWSDPDFDPAEQAFYYVRVLENPTCRWATRRCLAGGVDCGDPATVTAGFEPCCLDTWERTIQERAWSSPIWYVPSAG